MKPSPRCLLLLALAGCATAPRCDEVVARAREALLAADSDFSRRSAEKGAAPAFYDFMAPEAVSLTAGEPPVRGREAIRDGLAGLAPGALTWRPLAADASCSGDLGYTWGTYEFRGAGPDGQPKVGYGKYMTVWKKQADGTFKAVLDGGNSSPPPQP